MTELKIFEMSIKIIHAKITEHKFTAARTKLLHTCIMHVRMYVYKYISIYIDISIIYIYIYIYIYKYIYIYPYSSN